MNKRAPAHVMGVRASDDREASLALSLLDRGENDGFLLWLQEVDEIALIFFEGIWDVHNYQDQEMWSSYCDGIPPGYFVQEMVLADLVIDFSEDMVLGVVANNLIWGSYR